MPSWTTHSLGSALGAAFGAQHVEEITDADAIHLTLPDIGDMGVTVALTERQILVSTPLVDADQVLDLAAFNEACMRLNPINPLSNLGLTTINGRDTYIVFGELAPDATSGQLELEIRTLADNAIDAVETLANYLVHA